MDTRLKKRLGTTRLSMIDTQQVQGTIRLAFKSHYIVQLSVSLLIILPPCSFSYKHPRHPACLPTTSLLKILFQLIFQYFFLHKFVCVIFHPSYRIHLYDIKLLRKRTISTSLCFIIIRKMRHCINIAMTFADLSWQQQWPVFNVYSQNI